MIIILINLNIKFNENFYDTFNSKNLKIISKNKTNVKTKSEVKKINSSYKTFKYCERKSVHFYYRISERGCLENDSEMSRVDFEYLVRNFDTIINCEVKDGVEK